MTVQQGDSPGEQAGDFWTLSQPRRLLSRDSRCRQSSFLPPTDTSTPITVRKLNHTLQKISKQLGNRTQAAIGGSMLGRLDTGAVQQPRQSRGNPAPDAAMALTALISPAI